MKKSDITLREFITKYVDYNTSCKLWIPYTGEERGFQHQLVFGEYSESQGDRLETAMEWEILKGEVPQSKYLDCTFTGVTDIYSTDNSDNGAVNITVLPDNVKDELYKPKDIKNYNQMNNIVI